MTFPSLFVTVFDCGTNFVSEKLMLQLKPSSYSFLYFLFIWRVVGKVASCSSWVIGRLKFVYILRLLTSVLCLHGATNLKITPCIFTVVETSNLAVSYTVLFNISLTEVSDVVVPLNSVLPYRPSVPFVSSCLLRIVVIWLTWVVLKYDATFISLPFNALHWSILSHH